MSARANLGKSQALRATFHHAVEAAAAAEQFSLTRRVAMSVDLLEPEDGIESADTLLDKFCTTQDESTESFAEVFDQLQALSLDLFARHKCLEVNTQQKSESDKRSAV